MTGGFCRILAMTRIAEILWQAETPEEQVPAKYLP